MSCTRRARDVHESSLSVVWFSRYAHDSRDWWTATGNDVAKEPWRGKESHVFRESARRNVRYVNWNIPHWFRDHVDVISDSVRQLVLMRWKERGKERIQDNETFIFLLHRNLPIAAMDAINKNVCRFVHLEGSENRQRKRQLRNPRRESNAMQPRTEREKRC